LPLHVFRAWRAGALVRSPWCSNNTASVDSVSIKHQSQVLRRSKIGGSWVSTQNLLSTHFLFTVYGQIIAFDI